MSRGDLLFKGDLWRRNAATVINTLGAAYAGDSTGSSNAYSITSQTRINQVQDGDAYVFKPNFTNTGAATLALVSTDPQGATKTIVTKDIVNTDYSALWTNEIISGEFAHVVYDADRDDFILMNPKSPWLTWTPTFSASGSMDWNNVSNYLKYKKESSTSMTVTGRATGTTATSTSGGNTLYFTLPETLTSTNYGGGAYVSDAGNRGGFWFANTTTQIGVRLYDSTNYTLGAGRQISLTFTVEIV